MSDITLEQFRSQMEGSFVVSERERFITDEACAYFKKTNGMDRRLSLRFSLRFSKRMKDYGFTAQEIAKAKQEAQLMLTKP